MSEIEAGPLIHFVPPLCFQVADTRDHLNQSRVTLTRPPLSTPLRAPLSLLPAAALALLVAASLPSAAESARPAVGDRVQLAPHHTSVHNCLRPGQVATITKDDHDSRPFSLDVGCGYFTELDVVAESERAGLFDTASNTPLLLLSVDVEAATALPDATVTLRQTYLNGGADVREAAFFVPLRAGAAVHRLLATMTRPDGTVVTIETSVEPKLAARRHFDEAIAAGVAAALLERNAESEDVFKISLGAVPRHASVVVEVSFLAPLSPNADEDHPDLPSWRLVLPNSLLHRYETASDPFRDPAFTISAAVAASIESAARGVGPLSARLRVRSPRPLLRIYSPSHSAHARAKIDDDNLGAELTISVPALEGGSVVGAGSGASIGAGSGDTLAFAYKAAPRLGDLHFAFTDRADAATSDLAAIALTVERAAPPGGGWAGYTGAGPSNTSIAAAVSVAVSGEACNAALRAARAAQPAAPAQPLAPRSHDYVFVLDCSGSMDGAAMTNAIAALKAALEAIPQKTAPSIQIVFFGSNYEKLFPEGPRRLTPETLAAANARLDATRASLGGTEVMHPLAFAMQEPLPRGGDALPPLVDVFFLTDGDVGNTRDVIAMVDKGVKASGGRLRVHTIGIGNSVSTALVDGLAEAGSGSSAFVSDREGARGFRAKMALLMRTAVDGLAGETNGNSCRATLEWGSGTASLLGDVPASALEATVGGGEYKRFLSIIELPAATAGQGADAALAATALKPLGAARLTFTHSRTGETATVELGSVPHTITVAPAGSVALAQRAVQAALRAIEREEDAALTDAAKGALKLRDEEMSVHWQILGRHTSMFGRERAASAAAAEVAAAPEPNQNAAGSSTLAAAAAAAAAATAAKAAPAAAGAAAARSAGPTTGSACSARAVCAVSDASFQLTGPS